MVYTSSIGLFSIFYLPSFSIYPDAPPVYKYTLNFVSVIWCVPYSLLVPLRIILFRSLATPNESLATQVDYSYIPFKSDDKNIPGKRVPSPSLLNEAEKKNPLLLIIIPFLPTFMFDCTLFVLMANSETLLTLFTYEPLGKIGAMVLMSVLGGIALCPLGVFMVKLSLLRWHTETEEERRNRDDDEFPEPTTKVQGSPLNNPMLRMLSIVKEEGASSLWRGWPILAAFFFVTEVVLQNLPFWIS